VRAADNSPSVTIPIDDLDFHSFSFRDPVNRLFWWKGGLYRGIRASRAPVLREISQTDVVRSLIQRRKLIDTEITNLKLEGYDLIVRHRPVQFVSYPYEWSPTMLRDVALLILELELELLPNGLTLYDPQLWNVLFDGSQPIYIDFGSIMRIEENPSWWQNGFFERTVLTPLLIASKGLGRVVRALQRGYADEIQPAEVDVLLGRKHPIRRSVEGVKSFARKVRHLIPTQVWQSARKAYHVTKDVIAPKPTSTEKMIASVRHLHDRVSSLRIPKKDTFWSSYYEDRFYPFTPSSDWTPKHINVHRILSEISPKTVLDLGSNRGWYSQLAARMGAKVVAGDVDDVCVDQLYADARQENLDILPLVLDAHYPSPGLGVSYKMLPSATERLGGEFVMALALVHHLVFGRYLPFPQIVEGLASFSKKWLLVEFIAHDDEFLKIDISGDYSWYTLPNFIDALRSQFPKITTFQSFSPTRTLLLCEK
jgi:SAM-dependent methyltransferase